MGLQWSGGFRLAWQTLPGPRANVPSHTQSLSPKSHHRIIPPQPHYKCDELFAHLPLHPKAHSTLNQNGRMRHCTK